MKRHTKVFMPAHRHSIHLLIAGSAVIALAATAYVMRDVNAQQPPAGSQMQFPLQTTVGTKSTNLSETVSGLGSTQVDLESGQMNLQFPALKANGSKGFAREFTVGDAWQFKKNTRMVFWVKVPENGADLKTNGGNNMRFETSVRKVKNANTASYDAGGFSGYHALNIPPTGTWTKVIVNMHQYHIDGKNDATEHGNNPTPTKENDYNYYDALTRFGIIADTPTSHPVRYLVDGPEFDQSSRTENDAQIYSIAGTYVPADNKIIVTWNRAKNQNTQKHEVRYAFSDIHDLGWDNATAAPNGTITPPGTAANNGMVYSTTEIPTTGKVLIYIAIKPQNSTQFSQISIRLNLDPVTPPPPNDPPTVSAGDDATLVAGSTMEMDGTFSDDGFPKPPGTVSLVWTQVTGPAEVTAEDPSGARTGMYFPVMGSYTLRLTANDGSLSTNDDVVITATDNIPPVISQVQVSPVTRTAATISWQTDELAQGRIEYGTTPEYGRTTEYDGQLSTGHNQTISGLLSGTQYYYRVVAEDSSDNVALSPNNSFLTESYPPAVEAFTIQANDHDEESPGIQIYSGDAVTFTGNLSDADSSTLSWSLIRRVNGENAVLVAEGTGRNFEATVIVFGQDWDIFEWTLEATDKFHTVLESRLLHLMPAPIASTPSFPSPPPEPPPPPPPTPPSPDAICGNAICEAGEACGVCFFDCACDIGSSCIENLCREAAVTPVGVSVGWAGGGGGGQTGAASSKPRWSIFPASTEEIAVLPNPTQILSCMIIIDPPKALEARSGLLSVRGAAGSTVYRDVPVGAWYARAVAEIIQKGIASGYRDAEGNPLGLFGPERSLSYGEMMKMVITATDRKIRTVFGPPALSASLTTHWAEDYIGYARKHDWYASRSLTDPDKQASRGAIIHTLLEAANLPLTPSSSTSPFTDLPANHPHAQAILAAAELTLIQGDKDTRGLPTGHIRPDDPMNRAEFSVLLQRLQRLECN